MLREWVRRLELIRKLMNTIHIYSFFSKDRTILNVYLNFNIVVSPLEKSRESK